MRKPLLASAALFAALIPAAANAVPLISFTQNQYSVPPRGDTRLVQTFESSPDGGSPFVPGPGESKTGDVRVFSVTQPGTAVDPHPGLNGNYLSIVNGSYTLSLGEPVAFFSFILGSLDNYNTLTFNYADSTSQTFTGRQIIGDTGTGPFNSATSGRVNYDFVTGPKLASVQFSSGAPAFEIDDIVASAPEPASWLTMILGFGAVGGFLRRRRRVNVAAVA